MQISYLNSYSIRWRKAKTATLTFTFYSGGEEKRRRKRWKIFVDGFGLGPETFANFWRVSVLHLVSEKCLGFGFGEFGLGKKVSVSVMGEFGFGIDFGQSFGIVI